jgi:hypothetical protein
LFQIQSSVVFQYMDLMRNFYEKISPNLLV